jgi:DNA (cytosine-5)-methyltransferase 3A
MNVLSLFDGMSCGQIALDQLDFNVDNYYAAEIDKYAIQVAKNNYPNTKHLGDVTELKGEDLPKIDLLIGGSPCQGFSFAGKQLNFDDPRSALFFEFVRLLKETKPKYFMLENVFMKQEYQDVISEYLGVSPIKIDSKDITAARRRRLYWTNIPVDPLVKKDVKLSDVLDADAITDKDKAYCLTLHQGTLRDYFKKSQSNIVYVPSKLGKYEVVDGKINMKFARGKNPNELFTFNANVPNGRYDFRTLNLSEACALHNVDVSYFEGASKKQAMDMLGNGWTVDVIKHIFKGMK